MPDSQQFPPGRNHIGSRAAYCNRSVWFAATEADQFLLQTIDHLLEAGDYSSFSELCKQALRAWLLPSEPQADSTLILLQQQIVALQLQVNQLSQQLSQPPAPAEPIQSSSPPAEIAAIEAQITILIERVTRLEQPQLEQRAAKTEALELPQEFPKIPVSAIPARETDPLLDRLVALLEDF